MIRYLQKVNKFIDNIVIISYQVLDVVQLNVSGEILPTEMHWQSIWNWSERIFDRKWSQWCIHVCVCVCVCVCQNADPPTWSWTTSHDPEKVEPSDNDECVMAHWLAEVDWEELIASLRLTLQGQLHQTPGQVAKYEKITLNDTIGEIVYQLTV